MAKLYIKTYGCQMNVYDSVKMGDLLKPHGFELSEEPENADLVILNTCHIREKATDKVYSELGRIRKGKEEKAAKGENMMIAVAGCVAQAEGEEIFKRAPYVDIVVGPQSYQNLPELIEKAKRKTGWAIDLEFPLNSKFDSLPEESGERGVTAFLTVQEGCDKFCSFCCVPFTRGAEYSRPVPEIYREALRLVSLGVKEITLLGQNVSAYHAEMENGEIWGLGKLIKRLAEIDKLERIRYTTSHPNDMLDENLMEMHANHSKVMPFLHLPVQSGSDSILKAMNRKHDRKYYFEVIAKYREICPDIAFSSDFIVGYPGETNQDFEDTLDLIRQVNFALSYSFKYSPRPGTAAAVLENQIPEEVKTERLNILQELLNQQHLEYNKSKANSIMPVLIDGKSRQQNRYHGKTPYLQTVLVEYNDDSIIGTTVNVKIEKATQNSLYGLII
ncbi:tRNA (N6-isopentenyl adenosine(37)-C2)-methylthiotransferase MiaB [endosymbiont of Acanthamoeba sp. UWC8]|uniref:tRNA (N6-isopentenyl adenosine(37)-C2)-methylthiotransferase MiaB n=1 Tax=endosymbiont of Acanthamoeba sp. UWC8 TaxID=86106 RepID=UPI00056DF081|nr:tRNA (N6-isopentenyl adenosine(37)-C2)-methylthiotransferase MiaB [endosymbiont of Acanthamoeba sp. UWC8]